MKTEKFLMLGAVAFGVWYLLFRVRIQDATGASVQQAAASTLPSGAPPFGSAGAFGNILRS